jgi:3-hydroxyisobutyrate dehydrogenase
MYSDIIDNKSVSRPRQSEGAPGYNSVDREAAVKNIAVLGLGIMGGGIARNLLRKGFPVVVWNRNPERVAPLREAGARVAESPAAAAARADVVIDVVSDNAASRETWTGPRGELPAMRPGATAVECATLSTAWIRELSRVARSRGIGFLDAPMTGSKTAAEAGTLTLFVGAEASALEGVRPVLDAFSARIHHFGPPGAGMTYKLINNLMLTVQTLAAAEGLALAEKAGLDLALVSRALLDGASASPIVKAKLPVILERHFADTQFALRWMLKDLRYALELARELGVDTPAARMAEEMLAKADAQGWGGQDYAVVAQLYKPIPKTGE